MSGKTRPPACFGGCTNHPTPRGRGADPNAIKTCKQQAGAEYSVENGPLKRKQMSPREVCNFAPRRYVLRIYPVARDKEGCYGKALHL